MKPREYNRAAFLAKYYPDLRLTALPGQKVEIRDPQRREGIENFVRAYEQEIWEDLLKQATGKE